MERRNPSPGLAGWSLLFGLASRLGRADRTKKLRSRQRRHERFQQIKQWRRVATRYDRPSGIFENLTRFQRQTTVFREVQCEVQRMVTCGCAHRGMKRRCSNGCLTHGRPKSGARDAPSGGSRIVRPNCPRNCPTLSAPRISKPLK